MEIVKTSNIEVATGAIVRPDFSVVLVCWNNRSYLESCLHSLYWSGARSSFDVVVVDNGSTDGSQDMLRRNFPRAKLIENDHNVGLGAACNQGMNASAGRYVLLLNDDTLVNGPSLDTMVSFMDSTPHAAAVGGRLINPDGSFQSAHADFSSLLQEILIVTSLGEWFWPGYPSHKKFDRAQSVDWMSSACLLLRRSALAQIGFLDEEYFIYGDEVDLQFRLKKAGWQIWYLANVTTIHYGGRSMDRWRRRKMVYRGKLLFYRKHYGPLRTLLLRMTLAVFSAMKVVIWRTLQALRRTDTQPALELDSNIDILRLCWRFE